MRVYLLSLVLYLSSPLQAQVTQLPPTTVEQQLENITENNEDLETEDDSYQQQLIQYGKTPLNINAATADNLRSLRYLSPLQIESFLTYRNLLGKILSLYELQAVPQWDVETIKKVMPYVFAGPSTNVTEDLRSRFLGGDKTLLFRATQILERSRGYIQQGSPTSSFYQGSPQRLFLRYKYNYKNLLQYGFAAEKDAGEAFFNGRQNKGFDFYSAHFYARNLGKIKNLALGDFTVNMGQGLVQWMSLAFKKGPDITNIKRQTAIIRPYNSAGEINFHRGAAITIGKRNWEFTTFGSYRKIDANFSPADTLQNVEEDFVSSLQTSGLHRTKNENDDKNIQTQLAFGGNVNLKIKKLQWGLNAIRYQFALPIKREPQPYNAFSISGKNFGNYSTDYSYTFKNLHFFGEAAISSTRYPAFINGLLVSVANNVDMSFVYRNISKGYQSLYTSAFTESTFPTNERGLYAGISIKPTIAWKIDAYAYNYRKPFIRFRVNAPSNGNDYFVQLTYKPDRILEIYTRYKSERKFINYNPDDLTLSPVVAQPRQNWRTQFSYKITPSVTLRSRTDLSWFDKRGEATEKGFLIFADVLFKPMLKPLSGNVRVQYFETDGYNSRLYAYENDLLYSYAIPLFAGKGYRYYLNLNYDVTRKISLWLKLAQTFFPDVQSVGSGLDEINGNRRSEVKFQIISSF